MMMMLLPRRQLQMPFHKGKQKSKIPIKELQSVKCHITKKENIEFKKHIYFFLA